jgi:hypothetical protein
MQEAPMSFSLVKVEVERSGNEASPTVIENDFVCRADALDRAKQLAELGEKCGYNKDHGYWWFHCDERLFRLLVRNSSPVNNTAGDPIHAWAARGFSGLPASVLASPGPTGMLNKVKKFALKARRA